MDLSSIPKSESPSKLLTPWWDVGIHYATTAMLVLSLAAIGLQTTKDGFVCFPKVDCGAAFERNQSVRNGNVSYDALTLFRLGFFGQSVTGGVRAPRTTPLYLWNQ